MSEEEKMKRIGKAMIDLIIQYYPKIFLPESKKCEDKPKTCQTVLGECGGSCHKEEKPIEKPEYYTRDEVDMEIEVAKAHNYYTCEEVDELFDKLKNANLQMLKNHHKTHRGIQAEEKEFRRDLLALLDASFDLKGCKILPAYKLEGLRSKYL